MFRGFDCVGLGLGVCRIWVVGLVFVDFRACYGFLGMGSFWGSLRGFRYCIGVFRGSVGVLCGCIRLLQVWTRLRDW